MGWQFTTIRTHASINGDDMKHILLAIAACTTILPALAQTTTLQPKAKTWAMVVVPLTELAAANKTIDGILLQGGADSYKPYYVTRIQFE
jgi:hypothetical protein